MSPLTSAFNLKTSLAFWEKFSSFIDDVQGGFQLEFLLPLRMTRKLSRKAGMVVHCGEAARTLICDVKFPFQMLPLFPAELYQETRDDAHIFCHSCCEQVMINFTKAIWAFMVFLPWQKQGPSGLFVWCAWSWGWKVRGTRGFRADGLNVPQTSSLFIGTEGNYEGKAPTMNPSKKDMNAIGCLELMM